MRELEISEPLKPCPFCGKNHILHNETEHKDRPLCTWTATVFCANCSGSTSNHGFDWTQEEALQKAVKAWNRRA